MKPRSIILKTTYCKISIFNSLILNKMSKKSKSIVNGGQKMVGMEEEIRLAVPSELTHSASAKLSVCCVTWVHF